MRRTAASEVAVSTAIEVGCMQTSYTTQILVVALEIDEGKRGCMNSGSGKMSSLKENQFICTPSHLIMLGPKIVSFSYQEFWLD